MKLIFAGNSHHEIYRRYGKPVHELKMFLVKKQTNPIDTSPVAGSNEDGRYGSSVHCVNVNSTGVVNGTSVTVSVVDISGVTDTTIFDDVAPVMSPVVMKTVDGSVDIISISKPVLDTIVVDAVEIVLVLASVNCSNVDSNGIV